LKKQNKMTTSKKKSTTAVDQAIDQYFSSETKDKKQEQAITCQKLLSATAVSLTNFKAKHYPLLPNFDSKQFVCGNASIIPYVNKHYIVVVRQTNWVNGRCIPFPGFQYAKDVHPEHILINQNIVLLLNERFEIVRDDGVLVDVTGRVLKSTGWYGFEDIRICEVAVDKFVFMCTIYDHEGGKISQMARCLSVFNHDRKRWEVVIIQPLRRFGGETCKEKNWLMFKPHSQTYCKDDDRLIIYHWFPKFTILKLPLDGNHSVVSDSKSNIGSLHEGSCPPVFLPSLQCWMALVHVSWPGPATRYYHRAILLRECNDTMEIFHYGAYFCFQTEQVEYCCGMCLSADGSTIVFTYGVNDASSFLTSMELKTFLDKVVFMLEKI